jgi:uncharacterized protein
MTDRIRIRQYFLRYLALFSGLFVIANGIVCTISANLGVNPWDVLHIGISGQTGFTIGRIMQGVGLLLIVVSFLLKAKINIGTLLNMYFLGYFVDMIIKWGYVPNPDLLWLRIPLYVTGVIIFGFGVAFYISANLGAGPRDSLMLALSRITSIRAGTIRTLIEVTAAITGFLLGGPLGIGTAIFALTVGFFMELGFTVIGKIKKTELHAMIWNGRQKGLTL